MRTDRFNGHVYGGGLPGGGLPRGGVHPLDQVADTPLWT